VNKSSGSGTPSPADTLAPRLSADAKSKRLSSVSKLTDAIRKREPMLSSQGCVALSEIDGLQGDESELLRAGRAGDLAALDALLERPNRPLLGLCCGILGHADDAEDAVQETFLRALRGLAGFRGEAAFGTWLFRIAVNVCLRWKAGRHPEEPWDE